MLREGRVHPLTSVLGRGSHGAVCGTWQLDGDLARVAWFRGAGRMPRHALQAEVGRLSSILDRDLDLAIANRRTATPLREASALSTGPPARDHTHPN